MKQTKKCNQELLGTEGLRCVTETSLRCEETSTRPKIEREERKESKRYVAA
jgi:hypothetical protein